MRISTVPPPVTRWLNALIHGFDSDDPAFAEFEEERERFLAWLELESTFSMDDSEAAILGNLAFCWQQVDEAIAGGQEDLPLETITRALVEAYALRDRLKGERRARRMSTAESVNSALLAGQAHLAGRVEREALAKWLPQVEAYLDAAWERGLTTGIPASEKGFTAFGQGVEEWKTLLAAAQPTAEGWEDALRWIGFGADSIETFFSSLSNGPPPSLLESRLCACRDLAKKDEVEPVEEALEDLGESWRNLVDTLLLTWTRRQELEDQMEEALEMAREALEDDPSGLPTALDRVAEVWKAAEREHAGRPSLASDEEALLDAVAGALGETVPDLILSDLLDYSQDGSEMEMPGGNAVRRYLEDGDIGHLHKAVDRLLSSAPQGGEISIPTHG